MPTTELSSHCCWGNGSNDIRSTFGSLVGLRSWCRSEAVYITPRRVATLQCSLLCDDGSLESFTWRWWLVTVGLCHCYNVNRRWMCIVHVHLLPPLRSFWCIDSITARDRCSRATARSH